MAGHGSPKGVRQGGRKKGTPNKTTTTVKEALQKAFKDLGGVGALTQWAKGEPTEFYKLYAKLLPKELEVSGSLTVEMAERLKQARERANV